MKARKKARGYIPGISYELRFGGPYGSDEHGVCLYGDINHPAAHYACEAAGYIEYPDQAALSDHQKVSFWFRFSDIRPYGKVRGLFNRVADLLEKAGWKMAPAIDNLPDTGSSIGGLEDTTLWPNYRDETEFPAEPNAYGYNAAREFCIVVEKLGTKPEFTPGDIKSIRSLAKKAARIVYGQKLEENRAK